MAKEPKNNGTNPLNVNNIEVIKTFLENQKQELANQAQEIELRKEEGKFSHDYACKALEAQKVDRKEEREKASEFMKYFFWLALIVLILFSSFVGFCLYLDKTAILGEVLKAMIYILPTLFGGYFYGYSRGKKNLNQSESYAEIVDDDRF